MKEQYEKESDRINELHKKYLSEHYQYEAMIRREKANLGIGSQTVPLEFLVGALKINDEKFV